MESKKMDSFQNMLISNKSYINATHLIKPLGLQMEDTKYCQRFECKITKSILYEINNGRKEILIQILSEKHIIGRNGLFCFFGEDNDVEKIIFLLNFVKENCSNLFFEKDHLGRTVLHCIFFEMKDEKQIEYILNFFQENYPYLIYEKDRQGDTILHVFMYNQNTKIIPFVLELVNRMCPDLFSEKNKFGNLFFHNFLRNYSENFKVINPVLGFLAIHHNELLIEDYK